MPAREDTPVPPSSTLDDLLRAYRAALTRGEPVTPEALCRDQPELLLDLLRRLESARATEIPRTDHPVSADSSATQPDARDVTTELSADAEPLPGYRLVRRLGRGGYGEVWEALAPGGFRVAFKFVSLEERAGAIELQALEIIRNLRHPNLLTVFGTWQSGGRLIIGMELADATLWDELAKASAKGRTGLPRRPLVRWSLDAARVIDYLNKPRHFVAGAKPVGIQHGDIKPQNILLVGQGVKVGDFGLVRLLRASVEQHIGGMTPLYAAPEVLEGRVSRWSDQYSLAVTWCQLRGGRLPFKGESVHEVRRMQREQQPDLSMLPDQERPIVARALGCDPRQRWPDCRAFVKALAECQTTSTGEAESGPREPLPPAGAPRAALTPRLEHGASPPPPMAQTTLRTSLPHPASDPHMRVRKKTFILATSLTLLITTAVGLGLFLVATNSRRPNSSIILADVGEERYAISDRGGTCESVRANGVARPSAGIQAPTGIDSRPLQIKDKAEPGPPAPVAPPPVRVKRGFDQQPTPEARVQAQQQAREQAQQQAREQAQQQAREQACFQAREQARLSPRTGAATNARAGPGIEPLNRPSPNRHVRLRPNPLRARSCRWPIRGRQRLLRHQSQNFHHSQIPLQIRNQRALASRLSPRFRSPLHLLRQPPWPPPRHPLALYPAGPISL